MKMINRKTCYTVVLKSSNKEVLLTYRKFLTVLFGGENVFNYSVFLPTRVKKITLLKSPHVYKKAKEQFEIRLYTLLLSFSFKFSKKSLNYLIKNKPVSINIRIKQTN